jgi:hypothetical protein
MFALQGNRRGITQMSEASIYLIQVRNFSESLRNEIDRVPDHLFNRRPGPRLNPIGWNYFHLLRIWDLDLNWLCKGQDRNLDAWHRGGFTGKSGYNPVGKGGHGLGVGFGYSDDEVDELNVSSALLGQYHDLLLADTEAYLANASDEELSRQAPTVLDPNVTKATAEQVRHIIGHSYGHIGEIRYAMGMFGLYDHSYPVTRSE